MHFLGCEINFVTTYGKESKRNLPLIYKLDDNKYVMVYPEKQTLSLKNDETVTFGCPADYNGFKGNREHKFIDAKYTHISKVSDTF